MSSSKPETPLTFHVAAALSSHFARFPGWSRKKPSNEMCLIRISCFAVCKRALHSVVFPAPGNPHKAAIQTSDLSVASFWSISISYRVKATRSFSLLHAGAGPNIGTISRSENKNAFDAQKARSRFRRSQAIGECETQSDTNIVK